MGVGCGSLIGSWINYQTGVIAPPPSLDDASDWLSSHHNDERHHPIMWPSSVAMVTLSVTRTLIGLLGLLLVRSGVRSLAMRGLCAVVQVGRGGGTVLVAITFSIYKAYM